MSEQEPSYYEIALTNRQVLVAFVILLCCVLASFFAGVWVGRGSPASASSEATTAAAQPTPSAEAPQELAFFNDQNKQEAQKRPDLQQMAQKPRQGTTLAQDVGVEDASPTPADEEPAATEPGEPPAPAAAVAAAPSLAPAGGGAAPHATAAAPAGALFIQVFSSKDEAQAKKLARKLRDAKLPAFLSPAGGKYRVRIGPYKDRAAAEQAAAKTRRDFHVDTWITATP